jgi:hypothetical protein
MKEKQGMASHKAQVRKHSIVTRNIAEKHSTVIWSRSLEILMHSTKKHSSGNTATLSEIFSKKRSITAGNVGRKYSTVARNRSLETLLHKAHVGKQSTFA